MSLLDFTPAVDAFLRNEIIHYARVVDVFLDTGVRSYWERYHPITIDDGSGPVFYQPVGGRIVPPSDVTDDQSLESGTIEIQFDSARAPDNTDFVGELVDLNIIQRRIRIRTVLFDPESNYTVPVWIFNEQNGVIDEINDDLAVGAESLITLNVASGIFAYLERLEQNYTNAHQQDLHPGDTSLSQIPQLVDVNLPWAGEFR